MRTSSIVLSVLLLVGAVMAQTEVELRLEKEKLEAAIRKIDRNVISTDSLTQLEATRFEEKKARQAESVAQKKAELDTLSEQLVQLQSQIRSEAYKQSSYKMKTENIVMQFEATAQRLSVKAGEVAAIIEQGIPWDLESRVARVTALKRDLEVGTATAEEGASRLAAILREEIKFSDEIALAERSITRNNGELINVNMLRLGNVWMVYMDAAGLNYGRLSKKKSADGIEYVWDEELSFEERKAVREAIEIKMAKRAPELILLPLSISLKEEVQ